jgi:2-polyprenyl-6-methoxyphenol hydroxylase-like FAD-dependent oxidoreductase
LLKKILVSGASIAGPALAWWLKRSGFEPVLIERAPAPRPGGHAVDIRGKALDVLAAMGLLDAARAARTTMKGVSGIDSEGRETWRSDAMTITGGNFDNDDVEILRDDLSGLLLGALAPDIEIVFGDSVTGLVDRTDDVLVRFGNSPDRTFDLVVGADGLRSTVRDLAFDGGDRFLEPMDVAVAIFSAPNHLGLEDWQIDYQDGKDHCLIYTARDNSELRAGVGFAARLDEIGRDRESQMAMVRAKCGHMGWEVPRLLAAMPSAPDFYLGVMAQVKMPAWSEGRVALVGDAGYCPSPYSGQGTSLALVGAYMLARALAASPDDHIAAFARYEATMRPFVEANQAIAQMSRDERFHEPDYYAQIQAALDIAKNAIDLDGPWMTGAGE